METEIITSNEELTELIKNGDFFNFCIATALNKGYRDALKEKKEIKFMVGDYEVEFDHEKICFMLVHQVYFARIIAASYGGTHFIGDDQEEVINELLIEFKKECIKTLTPPNEKDFSGDQWKENQAWIEYEEQKKQLNNELAILQNRKN